MKQPTEDQREALVRIGHSRDGQVLSSYVADCLKDNITRMIADEDAHRVRAHQGECRVLRVLYEKLNPVSPERPGME